MNNVPDILKIIDDEYEEWIPLKIIVDNAEIADRVKAMWCDTRDFAIGWNFKKPEPYRKAECRLEDRTNEGLARVRRIEHSKALQDYLIEPGEIVPWLKKICEKSGGYDKDWRYLEADVDGCRNWEIKYIRFIRHDNGRFLVCNAYWMPVKWRKILDNLKELY